MVGLWETHSEPANTWPAYSDLIVCVSVGIYLMDRCRYLYIVPVCVFLCVCVCVLACIFSQTGVWQPLKGPFHFALVPWEPMFPANPPFWSERASLNKASSSKTHCTSSGLLAPFAKSHHKSKKERTSFFLLFHLVHIKQLPTVRQIPCLCLFSSKSKGRRKEWGVDKPNQQETVKLKV